MSFLLEKRIEQSHGMLTVHAAGETTSTVQDDAVLAAYNQGITIVAAAGNNDVSPYSRCNYMHSGG